VNLRRLQSRCESLVRQLDIPSPFDVRELCERAAEHSGRPIHLEPTSLPAEGPCGLWVATPRIDFIFYELRTSRLHQEHIIAHELGHLLCDHRMPEAVGEDVSRLLLPELDPEMVRRVLRRTHYSAAEEQEAEMIASLILQQANHRPADPAWTAQAGTADLVHRLERSLRQSP